MATIADWPCVLCELFQQQGRDRFHMLRNNVSLDSVSERIADQLRQEQARMQPPLPKPKPTVSQMLDLANVVAKEVIDSNVLNEALQRQPRHMSAERYFRILIILLIAAAMFLHSLEDPHQSQSPRALAHATSSTTRLRNTGWK